MQLSAYLKALCIGLLLTAVALVPTASASPGDTSDADDLAAASEYVADLEAQLAELDAQIAAREQYLDQNREKLAEARLLLSQAEDRYAATLELYEQRITAIYKMGEDRFLEILLSSEDINDASSRVSYMLTISENDKKLVKQVKQEAEEVRAMHARVDELKQESDQGIEELRRQRGELLGRVESGKQQVEETKKRLASMPPVPETSAADAPSVDIYDSLLAPTVVVSDSPPPGLRPTGAVLSGVASWYGPGFHGQHTANGEIYDMFAFTAAHKTLPFNTWLKVNYRGRSVFVRINDRGPYVGGRFLDLSAAAAQALGLSGIGYVSAEVYR